MGGNYLEKTKGKSLNRFKVWLEQAKYDLEIARISHDSGYYEWACYQSIQSVEKLVKSVIVHSGYRPPRIHKLGVLLSIANRANKAFENVKLNFRKVESFTFISRYPFIIPGQNNTPHEMISADDSKLCIRLATDIFEEIQVFLKGQKIRTPNGESIEMQDYYFTQDEIDTRLTQIESLPEICEKLDIKKIILFGSFSRELIGLTL
ncbi:MAG: HEPN domain-containing protein [Candidatus Dojkabacteria bacterium]|nr:HEPN domain-containing protein [Candidatus Dojkabacteria bacterium]